MVRTVVVPLDGTPASERALAPAHELSARFGGPMALFANAGDDEDEVAAYLDRLVLDLTDRPVTTEIHLGYDVGGLADTVRRMPDAAVCMAPGTGGGPDTLIGPMAEEVIDRGGAPVVLVGPSYAPGRGLVDGERGLVVCADGSAGASTVEPVVAEWASVLDLEVHLVTVAHHDQEALVGMPVERVLREVGNLAFRLERRDLRVHLDLLDDGTDAALAITAHAAGHRTALVAASTRGHRHRLHQVLGDTVVRIVRLSPVPVLVARPPTAAMHS